MADRAGNVGDIEQLARPGSEVAGQDLVAVLMLTARDDEAGSNGRPGTVGA